MRSATAKVIVAALILGTSVLAENLFEPKQLSAEEKAKVDAAPLGSKDNPVRCEAPAGERAYLKRLRCPSGGPPTFERGGSVGLGPYETTLDRYEVRCPDWPESAAVYMDMYHVGYEEDRAIPRFSIVKSD